MNYKLFSMLYNEAIGYENVDMYIGERGWQNWMDIYSNQSNVEDVADILKKIFTLSKLSIKELWERTGITMAEFGRIYRIPARTVQDWAYGKSNISNYLKALITYTIFVEEREKHVIK